MTTHAHARPLMVSAVRLAAAVVALAGATPASAQPAAVEARAFISVSGGLQALTDSFSQDVVFPESGGAYRELQLLSGAAAREQARFESSYRSTNAFLFDVSGGVRLAHNLGVGIGVSRFGSDNTASVSAQAPHPIFYARDRSISGASPPLTRSETAVHLQARVTVPAIRAVTVTVFGGPTVFNVTQQLVTDVRFTHDYPYDGAAFSSAVASRETASTIGFNVGADVAWYFTGNAGVGWLVRYSRATVELPAAGDGTLDVRAGGLHAAGGLRLRF